MTSSSTTGNFIFLEPTILKYKQDDKVVCLDNDGDVLCFEDPHLTQDFNALAKLETKQDLGLQVFVEERVADFDENLLTNANFKSINNVSSFTDGHSNAISTDSGNETSESACKSQKYKHPQLDETIAKRTRSQLRQSTSTIYNLLPHQIYDSFETNNSPVIKCKVSYGKCKRIKRRNEQKNDQTNKTVLNLPQPEKNCLNLQFDTNTNSELNKNIPDNKKATCENIDFNRDPNLNKIFLNEKETHGNSMNLNSPLVNKTIHNYMQPEEFSNLNKAPCGDSHAHENIEFSRDVNSSLKETFQNYEQFEIIPNLNKNVLDNETETYENTKFSTNIILPFENSKQSEKNVTNSLKNGVTVIDIIYQLDEFERMVHDFKTVVINELNTRGTNSKLSYNIENSAFSSLKDEDVKVRHDEELFISEMENEFKQQFSKNDSCIHNEEVMTFSTKMPKWKNILTRYNSQILND